MTKLMNSEASTTKAYCYNTSFHLWQLFAFNFSSAPLLSPQASYTINMTRIAFIFIRVDLLAAFYSHIAVNQVVFH